MPTPEEEREDQNQEAMRRQLIAALREVFTPLTERLTPDINLATVYRPGEVAPENKA